MPLYTHPLPPDALGDTVAEKVAASARAAGFTLDTYATSCATTTHPSGVACGMVVTHAHRGDVARVVVMVDGRHWYQSPTYGSPLEPLPWMVDRQPTPRANELRAWAVTHHDDLHGLARERQRVADAQVAIRRADLERLARGAGR